MTELKPCPFCGSKAITDMQMQQTKCGNRNCPFQFVMFIKDWNARPSLWTTITDEASLPKESGTYLTVESNRINKMNRVLTYYTKEDGWIGVSQNWIIKWMPIPEDE